jgi:excisionase family DNA binding protein
VTTASTSTPWRTVAQAAARAVVGSKTIYREAAAGRLRCARIGGRRELRFRDEWIDQWLEACATPQEIKKWLGRKSESGARLQRATARSSPGADC